MKRRNRHNYSTEMIQQRLIPIVVAIDKVCREHNLRYYLWAGTQLGAVRHAGFIPWDDDVDVAMPRKDYEVLLKHADEWFDAPLKVANHLTNSKYPHYFARVHDTSTTMVIRKHLGYVEGIHVDIFPIDSVANSRFKRALHYKRLSILHRLLYLSSRSSKSGDGVLKRAYYGLFGRLFKQQNLLKKIDRSMQRFNNSECDFCTDSFYGGRRFIPNEYLGKPKPINFEGIELLGVEMPHEYLTYCYGDYMKIPAEKDRIQHSVDYLDFDRPFAQFDIKSLDEE